jgi:hypothetical protein
MIESINKRNNRINEVLKDQKWSFFFLVNCW